MAQDAFTLRYLAEELDEEFRGGKVNRITEPTTEEVVFTIYNGKGTQKLYISVNPSCPRIGMVAEEQPSPLTAPNFCMLLRKHLLSASVDKIALVGFDRIIRIDFTAEKEFSDGDKKTLFVELMGRYSNIILVENGKVLGGNRGVNFFDNGVRPLIVGKNYVFPPTGDKKEPKDETLIEYFEKFNCSDKKTISDYITFGVQGIAQDTAKEIVRAYYAENTEFTAKNFYDFLVDFIYNTPKNPCVIIEGGKLKDVCSIDYKEKSGDRKYFNKLYLAEDFYFTNKNIEKQFLEKTERAKSIVNSALKKAKKRLAVINARIADAKESESDKIKGDLILSNIYKIKQGDEKCKLYNYYEDTEIEITLDRELSPSKNAEKFYKRYAKGKRTILAQTPQKELAESEIAYLTAVADEISLAENIDDVKLILEELKESGYIAKEKTRQKPQKQQKYRHYYVDGFNVFVGRNNIENDELTFSARAKDIWLHAKDYHSSHVIIEAQNKEIPKSVLLTASEICAYYSKGREGGKVEIVYTQKKYVKKPPKSKLGFCTYSEFKSITVMPNAHSELLK